MKIVLKGLVFTVVALFMGGCYVGPSNNELMSEYNVIFTKYNKAYSFNAKKYFAINSEVYVVGNDGTTDSLSASDASTIINNVKANMQQRGYIYVYKIAGNAFGYNPGSGVVLQDPDLAINISGVKNTTTVTNYYPGGGYYGGYWGYGWGYYYPYYPTSYSYSYTNGLLIVDMFDYDKTITAGEDFIVEWTGVVRGIDTGAKSTNMQAALGGVNQMFAQSPYIKAAN